MRADKREERRERCFCFVSNGGCASVGGSWHRAAGASFGWQEGEEEWNGIYLFPRRGCMVSVGGVVGFVVPVQCQCQALAAKACCSWWWWTEDVDRRCFGRSTTQPANGTRHTIFSPARMKPPRERRKVESNINDTRNKAATTLIIRIIPPKQNNNHPFHHHHHHHHHVGEQQQRKKA